MKKAFQNTIICVLFALFLTGSLRAQQCVVSSLSLPDVYTSHMVLQHTKPLPIEGTAPVGAHIEINIDGHSADALTDSLGHWQATLQPLQAGGPYTLTVTDGQDTLRYEDVLAGEVWFCSGQSNMAFALRSDSQSEEALAKADRRQLRFYNQQPLFRPSGIRWTESACDSVNNGLYFADTKWEICTPETAENMSAVAYYFGAMLQDSLQIPIGLITNSLGGTTTESYIDRETLQEGYPELLDDWRHNPLAMEWARGRVAVNITNATAHDQRHPYEPSYLFDTGVSPLSSYTIRGAIWYQGESNAHDIDVHARLFPLLVQSWRKQWHDDMLPFYFVQLTSINRPTWPAFRDSQRRLLDSIPYTGMAVTHDVGHIFDVHPKQKKPVGERLARWALYSTYQHSLTPCGPLFKSVSFHHGKAFVSFRYDKDLHSSDGEEIRGFEVADASLQFHPAKAVVSGSFLIAWSDEVSSPAFVRYAWQPYTEANLVNADNLPASTFTSEIEVPQYMKVDK